MLIKCSNKINEKINFTNISLISSFFVISLIFPSTNFYRFRRRFQYKQILRIFLRTNVRHK